MKIPFDIKYRPQIESGEYKLETECGHPVSIMDWEWIDRNEKKCLAVKVLMDEGFNIGYLFDYDGKRHSILPSDSDSDLFIITPEPELSEFEDALKDCVNMRGPENPMTDEGARNNATILRAIAFKEFKENEASHMKEAYERGKAKALRTHATELTENLDKSGLDKDGIPYHLIEFMCNLYTCPNWEEIEETAELYTTRIKAAALKDLPRWGPSTGCFDEGWLNAGILYYKFHAIPLKTLEKLPGFKED